LGEASVDILGETISREGIKQFFKHDTEALIYKKIFVQNNIVVGCVLINCRDEKSDVIHLMDNKVDVADQLDRVLGPDYQVFEDFPEAPLVEEVKEEEIERPEAEIPEKQEKLGDFDPILDSEYNQN